MDFYRLKDRLGEWFKYKQPTRLQRKLTHQFTDVIDTDWSARIKASAESSDYIVHNMRSARNFANDYDHREYLVALVPDSGLLLEFGVATGRSINQIARHFSSRTVHGFDSFEGLPETWDWRHLKGHFAQPLPKVRSNVQLHVGWFNDTLEPFLQTTDEPIALLHIDSDLYSSAKYVLDNVVSRLQPGSIVMFDEYLNYPGYHLDEFKAWHETCATYNVKYEYLSYVSRHQQAAVRIVSNASVNT